MSFDPHIHFAPQNASNSINHLGWRLIDFDREKGWIKTGFTPREEFLNPRGFVQGGFIAAMLDATLSPAVIITSDGRYEVPTIDLHTHYLKPLSLGNVTAEATVTKLGRTIAFTEGQLFDSSGNLCARATASSILVAAAAQN